MVQYTKSPFFNWVILCHWPSTHMAYCWLFRNLWVMRLWPGFIASKPLNIFLTLHFKNALIVLYRWNYILSCNFYENDSEHCSLSAKLYKNRMYQYLSFAYSCSLWIERSSVQEECNFSRILNSTATCTPHPNTREIFLS